MDYDIVIGLEIHVELATKTKMYCSCKNSFGSAVNSNVCPICAGLPGTLPVLNKKAVELALKAGMALNCKLNKKSKQDRKNYFYPDLPKGYQISQHDIPMFYDGYVDIIVDDLGTTKRIGITRIHIEEDAGKLIHDKDGNVSLLDLNRSGVPLIEIVSEPDISSAKEAKIYLETIKSILESLGVSDCKMQEGSMRCDVNVSLKPAGSNVLGVRCETKNVNTFNGAFRAIEYEIARQKKILDEGGVIFQETRRWDDNKGENILLRSKENSNDYRYFKEPDLMEVVITDDMIDKAKSELKELPNVKIKRFVQKYKLPMIDAVTLVNDLQKAVLFEECAKKSTNESKLFSNWILGDISRLLNEKNISLNQTNINSEKLIEVVNLINAGKISNTSAKIVIENIMFSNKSIDEIIEENNLLQVSDQSELEQIVKNVLEQNPQIKELFSKGKTNILGFAVGQCMKMSKGKGNPQMLKDMILNLIK